MTYGIVKKMQKIKDNVFWVVINVILLILIIIPFYYSHNYWTQFFFARSLPLKHKILLDISRVSLLIIATLMVFFRNQIYNKRREIFLFLFTFIFCFILLEISSRYYVCNFAEPEIQSNVLLYDEFKMCGLKSRYSPHPYLNDYGTPNFRTSDGLDMHNSLGFRGPEIEIPKPSGRYRIVILGGSSAYESGVYEWKKDFARQLEKELRVLYNTENIEVINAALPGYTSYENLINLELKVLDLKPDMVIIYEGVNDFASRLVNPENYHGDNTGLAKQWDPPKTPIVLKSMFVRLIIGNPIGVGNFLNPPDFLYGTTEEKILEALEKNPPIYFKRNLENMVVLSNYRNATVLLSTWAHSDEFGDLTSSYAYEKGYEEMNVVVKEVGAENNVLVYDFVKDMPKDKKYWVDGRHVNDAGAELKGKLFAEYIYKNDLVSYEIR